ncbi:hypothetical protein F5Y15DRAFT_425002 [Xylariaceae sp. FL0016]|nr:hypothetical protein F5Y15DRAFT_425002 [Xylariaceae sp. FL0016]
MDRAHIRVRQQSSDASVDQIEDEDVPVAIDMRIWQPNGAERTPVDGGRYCRSADIAAFSSGPRVHPSQQADETHPGSAHYTTTWRSSENTAHPPMPPHSRNYRGNLDNPNNLSALIPEHENCSTFWINLPATCTYSMLFNSMRGVGKISHASITGPNDENSGSCAKVEFFDRVSVDRLFRQLQMETLRVGGYVPRVRLNKYRVPPQTQSAHKSRVLIIDGPRACVTKTRIEKILSDAKLTFGLESYVMVVDETDHTRVLEYRFASYRAQSVRARAIINAEKNNPSLTEEEKKQWEQVTFRWGDDPCD